LTKDDIAVCPVPAGHECLHAVDPTFEQTPAGIVGIQVETERRSVVAAWNEPKADFLYLQIEIFALVKVKLEDRIGTLQEPWSEGADHFLLPAAEIIS
jgi:hypothetical protein